MILTKSIKVILILMLVILLICVCFFLAAPVYNFEQGTKFKGNQIYNPYHGLDTSVWKKANFHMHPRATGHSSKEALEAYRQHGYDIVVFSDHQFINREQSERPEYIPTYEHGYGLNKFHKLVIGIQKVWWVDMPIMITRSQVQFMMHKLCNKAELLVLNHPGQLRFIDHSIYTVLRGYDLTELNPEQNLQRSTIAWDSALSSGIYSNLIANDDAHNITDRGTLLQRSFTMISTPSLTPEGYIASLKKGLSYGVYVPNEVNKRDMPHQGLPSIKNIGIDSLGTILAEFDQPADKILFITDSGHIALELNNTTSANYTFNSNNSYVRVEAHFANGVEILSNPFVRYNGTQPQNTFTPDVNLPMTIILNLIWVAIAGIIIMTILRLLNITPNNKFKRCKCNI